MKHTFCSSWHRILSLVLALVLLLSSASGLSIPAEAAAKYSGNGICNNGLNGIYINIYDYPYTHYAEVPTWGQYAYGPSGCAWFATSRACEITGFQYPSIYGGPNWYNNIANIYGYSRGQEPRAPALMCFGGNDGAGHIAVLESFDGSTGIISSGGYTTNQTRNHDYTILYQRSRNALTRTIGGNGQPLPFLGYVYLPGSAPAPHQHSYSSTVTPPTCTEQGYTTHTCSCGDSYVDTYVPALGHNWNEGTVLVEATCTSTGLIKYVCTRCSAETTQELPMLSHEWEEVRRVPATCADPGYTEFRCRLCGETKTESDSNGYTPWSPVRPQGFPDSQIESRTEYRYRDAQEITSPHSQLPGCILTGESWKETGRKSVEFVREWPAGFDKNHPLYKEYNNRPMSNTTTADKKIEVTGESTKAWIYWHWCRNSYQNGPINRRVSECWMSDYNTFHAHLNGQHPSTLHSIKDNVGDNLYEFHEPATCLDTYWYWALEVVHQNYTEYAKVYHYNRMGAWSQWSTEYAAPSDTREVETRTVYRARTGSAPDHTWDNGVVTKAPTENSTGIRTYTCTVCGRTRTETIPKLEKPEAPRFTDVHPTDYFYNSVMWAVDSGITSGSTATTFSPGESCTRAQAMCFLWRAAGSPEPSGSWLPFTDVPANAYYRKPVLWALERGITSGMTATEFGSDMFCTRGQIMVFLWRAKGCPEFSGTNPFTDVFPWDYYYSSVLWGVGAGITTGMAPNQFWPSATCTRGQIVTFLYNANK